MISDIGYGLSAIGYLLLVLLLFTVRKSGLAKYLLLLASISMIVWSLSLTSIFNTSLSLHHVLNADIARIGVWLIFIASFLRDDFTSIWQVLRRPATQFIILPPLITAVVLNYVLMQPSIYFLLMTILALEALILLEVLYRQAGENQWSFKPLILYLGATHLFDFVTYANATMVNNLEVGYIAARGYLYVLLLPLLIIAIRRIKHWGVDIFISRDVVLHSSLLLVAGAYLFIMAVLGYVVSYLGGSWGATVQIVLIAFSLVLLASVFLSNSFRTRIKVFITKHFFANQFDYRVEWLALTRALSAPVQSMTDVHTHALQGIMGSMKAESGILLRCQRKALNVISAVQVDELTEQENELLSKLADFCMQTGWFVDLEEYQVKPYHYENLQLPIELLQACRFRLVVPLKRGDELWGLAVLGEPSEEFTSLNWEVRDYLNAVSEQVATYLSHHDIARELTENAQFAAFSRMSAFVVHDLKNVLAQVDLILTNAEKHKDNPEFIDDTFETLHHTRSRMDKMLKQLTEKKVSDGADKGAFKLSRIVQEVINTRCQSLQPTPTLVIDSEIDVVVDADKLANVLYHLISNAQQATEDDGRVTLTLSHHPGEQYQKLLITDTGCGMSEEFIAHRLFKPFDTTKGNAGMGIGAYDAKGYMESIDGFLSVTSVEGEGSTFELLFPVY